MGLVLLLIRLRICFSRIAGRCLAGGKPRRHDVMHLHRERFAIGTGWNRYRWVERHAHQRTGHAKESADVRAGFHATVEGVAVAVAAD